MVKSAQASPASPRSTVSRKQFDKAPDSPGDELINAAVFRGVPVEGRSDTKALHLQVLSDDHDEDVSSMGSASMKSASSRCTGKRGKKSTVSPIFTTTGKPQTPGTQIPHRSSRIRKSKPCLDQSQFRSPLQSDSEGCVKES